MSDEMEGEGLRRGQATREYIARLCAESDRLKAGRFTPEEFQNLCHHLDENDREAFCKGCAEYQEKLFGKGQSDRKRGESMVKALLNRAAFDEQEIERLRASLADALIRTDELVEECQKIQSQFIDMEAHAMHQLDEIEDLKSEAERVRREMKAAQEILHVLYGNYHSILLESALLRLGRALDITGEYARENKARQKQAIASKSKSP